MTAGTAPIAGRLAQLLLMLSSDQDGEALAAVRAIGRTLRTAGCDWHDLARALTTPAAGALPPKPSGAAAAVSAWEMCQTIIGCPAPPGTFSIRDLQFVVTVGKQLRRGRTPLSEKQLEWLSDLYQEALAWRWRAAA